jgi:deoxyribodipyrimidine photolyase
VEKPHRIAIFWFRRSIRLDDNRALIEETRATALYFGRDYEPYSRERDKAVAEAMRRRGVAVEIFSDHLLAEPEDVLTKAGTPYSVFTPFGTSRTSLDTPSSWMDYNGKTARRCSPRGARGEPGTRS